MWWLPEQGVGVFLAFNCCGHGAASVRPTFAERFLDYYFPVRKTRICFEPFYVLNVVLIFYQDRLGTDIGKTLKREAFFRRWTRSRRRPSQRRSSRIWRCEENAFCFSFLVYFLMRFYVVFWACLGKSLRLAFTSIFN